MVGNISDIDNTPISLRRYAAIGRYKRIIRKYLNDLQEDIYYYRAENSLKVISEGDLVDLRLAEDEEEYFELLLEETKEAGKYLIN